MRKLRSAFIVLALLAAFPATAGAACRSQAGFAIFQCAFKGWFDAPPEGAGEIQALFWQIGFGNETIANGKGSRGAGVAPAGVFNGNDSGLARIGLLSAAGLLQDPKVPAGAVCVGAANWGNRGVDGCCDNARGPSAIEGDGFLNPYFDVNIFRKQGRFVPTMDRIQDYPMAILLKEETGRYFAAAAVAAASRGGRTDDLRPGHYNFAEVSDGEPNPLTGDRNVIPWQKVPEARLRIAGSAGEGKEGWTVEAAWDPVVLHGDASRRPSEAYEIDNPGGGAGVADMGPLVRYVVEKARVAPGQTGEDGYPDPYLLLWEVLDRTEETKGTFILEEDTCLRVAAHFGKLPRTRSISVATCSLGRCGDIGYLVQGPPSCLEGPVLARASGRARAD